MNRCKKEQLKKYTPEHIKRLDATKYPELYSYVYDSLMDRSDRARGISPMNKEFRSEMRERFERGDYPERPHNLVFAELNLKDPED